MKSINELIEKPKTEITERQYSQAEQDAVAYFFFKLKIVYVTQYKSAFPDDKTERIIKREYAPHICGFTRDQINRGIDALHNARREYPDDWEFMNIDKVIGLVMNPEGYGDPEHCAPAGIHKVFPPLLEDKTKKERAKEVGESELKRLKDLF